MSERSMSEDVPPEQPLGKLVSELVRDGSELTKREIALGKAEVTEKVHAFERQLASLVIGGLFALLGGVALTSALVLLLARVVPGWLAALLVGAGLSALAATLLLRAKQQLGRIQLKPERTASSVERDIDAIKDAVRDR